FAAAVNPVNTSVNSTTRTWTDTNGNFYPDCDLTNQAANGECGAGNANFGGSSITTRFDEAIQKGFGVRPYNWEASASVQHELVPAVSVNVSYFRRWYGNFTVTQNTLTSPANYDPFCITAPVDPLLPGGGGNRICGLYDVTPSLFQRVSSFVT